MDYVGDNNSQNLYGGIGIDTGGNAVAAYTTFTPSSSEQIFATKVDTLGNIKWTGDVGGYGRVYGLATDVSGHILIGGVTGSNSLPKPVNSPINFSDNAFVMKLNESGVSQWSRYIGGSDSEYYVHIAVHSLGNPVVGGQTRSLQIPGARM